MQIGFVMQVPIPGQRVEEGQKVKTYNEVSIRVPGMASMTLTMSKNSKFDEMVAQGKRAPQFYLYYSPNRKGEKFRRIRAGSLWPESKPSQDGGEDLHYLAGHIEHPLAEEGKIRIAIFRAKPQFDNEVVFWSHDVVWWPPKRSNTTEQSGEYDGGYAGAPSGYNAPTYDPNQPNGGIEVEHTTVPRGSTADAGRGMSTAQNNLPQIDIDEDEIPF